MREVSDKLKQVQALPNGKGVQYLLNCGYEILGNPLYIHDVDYKMVAHTENTVTDDPMWNELVTTGKHGAESIELFKAEDFIDAVAYAKIIALLSSPKLKYDRILGKIRNKENIVVACMDIVACYKPFQSGDALAFKALCGIVSKEFGRHAFYQTYGEQYQERIIRDLFDGSIRDKRLYTRRVESIYEGLKDIIHIAVFEIPKSSPEYARSTFFKILLRQTECAIKYAVYDKYVSFIFSSDDPDANINKSLHKLFRVLERNNMNIGISSGFENLYIAKRYYAEAVDALNSGLKRNDNQRIHLYNECR